MSEHWERLVSEWSAAGLLDDETAGRIRAFESTRAGTTKWRWPMWLALAFGATMLGAGVLLFVAAHWDELSPAWRFAIVLFSVSVFHVVAAFVSSSQPAVATALHAVGTVALGGGIFVSGQIFNLAEHWPGGVLLWAIGAATGLFLLRTWPQTALLALLMPVWLGGEWTVATGHDYASTARVLTAGIFLVALTYFAAATRDRAGAHRRAIVWIGGVMLLPAALAFAMTGVAPRSSTSASPALVTTGWAVALGLPLALAAWLRREQAWPNLVAGGWVIGLAWLQAADANLAQFAWWALGATGLVFWGLHDLRTERINVGAAIFAATVIAFYFSEVMDKLGRSASLIGLGLIFLGGGWAIERARRHFVRQAREERP
jgi:hypothetical protein